MPTRTSPRSTVTSLPEDGVVALSPWPDALADSTGHPVRGEYAERFWLGIIGPTAMWLLRRCSDEIVAHPAGSTVNLGPVAGSLGLAYNPGRHNPFARGFDRLVMFGLVRHIGNHPHPTYAVRTHVPRLAQRQVDRLPHELQVAHADFLTAAHGAFSATQ